MCTETQDSGSNLLPVTFVDGNSADELFTKLRLQFSLLIEQHLGEG
jgi:hypothetical protein